MHSLQLDRLSLQEERLRRGGYQQLEPFFVLREGEIKDERTGGVVKLDRARLQKIAAIQNNRIVQTGDFTPIIIGHTKRGKKENEQPELTGWASRYEVVPFMDTGTWGLRAVPWTRPHNLENFERFPRRSAELWTNPDLIDPISLLGANTPRLDLGLHRLQRSDEVEYYTPTHGRTDTPIYLEQDMADQSPKSSADKPDDTDGGSIGGSGGGNGGGGNSQTAAVFNSPEWKQMMQTVSEMAEIVSVIKPMLEESGMMGAGAGMGGPPGAVPPPGPGAMPPPGPGAMPPPGPPPQPEPGGLQQMSGHPMVGATPRTVNMPPAQLNAGSPGGYGNTQTPTMMSRDGGQYDPRDQRIAQLEQMVAAQTHQLAAMQLSMITSTVNGVLDDLEKKVTIDRPRDFERLVKLSRADLDAEVAFMLNTRKPIEPPTPAEGVPLHMQALGNQPGAARGPMGPIQLTLGQAHDMMVMPPDPAMAAQAAQPSNYDRLIDIVRNRGKLGNLEAYEQVMGRLQSAQGNGQSVRG